MKKINLFRLLVILFITVNFIISYKLENYAEIFIMTFTVIFTAAFTVAEAMHSFDNK